MKPPVFEYIRPADLDQAIAALGEGGVAPLAGGQSLMQELGRRHRRPRAVLDLNRLQELDYIAVGDDQVTLGALTRYRVVERCAEVAERIALLPEALSYVGHATIRHRGTVGGSLAYADPSGEFPCAAVVLDARIVLTSTGGSRTVSAEDFFIGPYSTVRTDTELITAIIIGLPPAHVTWAVEEFSRRHRDYAVVAAEVGIGLDDSGRIDYARIGVAGGGPTVRRHRSAEDALVGRIPTTALIAHAAALVAEESSPIHSVHADVEHRRHLVRVMTGRAISKASTKRTGEL
ncbi:xanthine dehydrogenase family protein subunit M [Gordonia desulfuricans]|uniref:Xanthine dehydrogenase family protein subunit M n=1 Tax=Gordonia desulfuricans TaxID=89051 RepID=A0A7K3LIV7_9ACTN|nr:xanthine dehydrogenase family protein subunit M [Gordonia desulfuricans]NDK88164.1 xanthine dehydrogenase family protein subunit M [Gordonia desulfuricans]